MGLYQFEFENNMPLFGPLMHLPILKLTVSNSQQREAFRQPYVRQKGVSPRCRFVSGSLEEVPPPPPAPFDPLPYTCAVYLNLN
jgi:hypothetical protein